MHSCITSFSVKRWNSIEKVLSIYRDPPDDFGHDFSKRFESYIILVISYHWLGRSFQEKYYSVYQYIKCTEHVKKNHGMVHFFVFLFEEKAQKLLAI